MQVLREKSIRDFILIHVIFAIIAAITLLFLFQATISGKLLVLVMIYNGLIIVEFYGKGYEDWKSIWTFTFIMSLLMVFADWYLAETVHCKLYNVGHQSLVHPGERHWVTL